MEARRAAISIVLGQLFLTMVYLIIHGILPPSDYRAFFWVDPKLQWVDWLFWSTSGVLLNQLSWLVHQRYGDSRTALRNSRMILRMAWGVFISILLLVLICFASIDLSGIHVTLKNQPAIGVGLAFIFGYYNQVTDLAVLKYLWEFLKKYFWKIIYRIPRIIHQGVNEQTYVEQYIDPELQQPYLLGAVTVSGIDGHKASMERLAQYKTAKFVGKAGFTLNALRMVFIGSIQESQRPKIVAHEASHVFQKYLSDSIDQEINAYITGAKVNFEITYPEEAIPDEPRDEWLKIDKDLNSGDPDIIKNAREKAGKKIRDQKSEAPLYGIIPVTQKKGILDFFEMMRQGGFLLIDALGLWPHSKK